MKKKDALLWVTAAVFFAVLGAGPDHNIICNVVAAGLALVGLGIAYRNRKHA